MTPSTCDIRRSRPPRRRGEVNRNSTKRGWCCALAIVGSIFIACQQAETIEHQQDDTVQQGSGGAPRPTPSPPRSEGGMGGGAGSNSEPEPEPEPEQKTEIPCEIKEIFADYCFKCHSNRIEPRLDLYETAVAAAPQIRGALVGTGPREMPPRETLPEIMRQQIVDWIKSGAPPAPFGTTCE